MATRPDQKPTIAPIVGPDDERRFTDSGIEIKHRLHRGRRRAEPRRAPRRARRVPVHARDPPGHVPRPQLDDAPVRGLRHRQGDQRALPLPDRARLDRAVDGVRPADPARPRLRRPAVRRRGGPHGRRHRHDRRHAARVRRHPAGPGVDVDDDQRAGRRAAAALRAGRRGAGRRGRAAARHDPERHAQGVHRARQLHLPARAGDAPDHRPVRLLPRAHAEVEHDLDLRLPHAREGLLGGPGGGLHARQRDRLRAGGASTPASTSTSSARGWRSSSTATTTSSRRWPSSAPCAGCGRASCASASAPRTSARRRCASTRRPAASRWPRSSRRTTSCAWRSRASPRCAAAPSRCTRTASTRRWRSRPSAPRASRCARSRSSPTSPAPPTPSTRSPAPTSSRRSPTRSRRAPRS